MENCFNCIIVRGWLLVRKKREKAVMWADGVHFFFFFLVCPVCAYFAFAQEMNNNRRWGGGRGGRREGSRGPEDKT